VTRSKITGQFIYDTLENVPSCHASTVAELPSGDVIAAWFGGIKESSPDSSHYWARKRKGETQWDPPQLFWDVPEHSAGNPRFFHDGEGVLCTLLPVNFGTWCNGGSRSFLRKSTDAGLTWSEPVLVPELDALLGKNKPIVLGDGSIVLPVTDEVKKTSAAVVYQPDLDRWVVSAPIALPDCGRCIQPTFTPVSDGRLLALMRSGCGRILRALSGDGGLTWSVPEPTALRNNDSGIDLIRLANGHHVLAFNDTEKGRTPLNLAVSTDDGETWPHQVTLEDAPGEYSYPAIIQAHDGIIHVTYTHLRKHIMHVSLSEEDIVC